MTTVIEKNFIDLQQKTTHVLVEQKTIVSDQEIIDNFLDKIIETKKEHAQLIIQYKDVIESTVEFLSESRSTGELMLLTESISNLVTTARRLITSFEDTAFKGTYLAEAKEYKILVSDISEIKIDIEGRIKKDKRIADLLDEL